MEEQIREKRTAGLICGIIGLVYANKGLKKYDTNPEYYKGDGILKASKIISIIGIVLNGIYLVD